MKTVSQSGDSHAGLSDPSSQSSRYKFVPILASIAAVLIGVPTDGYMANLPSLCSFFNLESCHAQKLISWYLLSYGFTALFYGPLSDSYGRRRVFLWGLSLFAIGSIFCALFISFKLFVFARILQGIGGGVGLTIGLATIRDLCKGARYSRMLSILGIGFMISAMFAPAAAGNMSLLWGWQSVFILFAVMGVGLFFLIQKTLPETLPKEKREPFSFGQVLKNYFGLTKYPVYLGYAMSKGLIVGIFWAETTCLSHLYIDHLHIPHNIFDLYFAFSMLLSGLGMLYNQYFVEKTGIDRMFSIGLWVKGIGILGLLAGAFFKTTSPLLIELLILPSAFAFSLIYNNTAAKALNALEEHKGAGSALMSSAQMAIAGGVVWIVTQFSQDTLFPLSIAEVLWAAGTLALITFARRREFSRNQVLLSSAQEC